MGRAKLNLYKYCSSDNIKKNGYRTNKRDKFQIFKCLECKRKLIPNFEFKKTHVELSTITGAMQMYFIGMSVRDIANHYGMMGIEISCITVYN